MVKKMKSFQQFISESTSIEDLQLETENKSFSADIVWQGKIYRLQIEGIAMNKNELTEQLQDEYPGAIVHIIYPQTNESSLKIKKSQRYQPERLSWSD
jgi:hypothetical protein